MKEIVSVANGVPNLLVDLLNQAHTKRVMWPTEVYNEGWMLRLALAAAKQASPAQVFPFAFDANARWFAEARLPASFPKRSRGESTGDNGDNATEVDGLVGHFGFSKGSKVRVELIDGATQLVALEAKMRSPLSTRTTHSRDFDQAVRTVSCMARAIYDASIPVDRMSLGFYVLAPESRRDKFERMLRKDGMAEKIAGRVEGYREKPNWYLATWRPFLDRVKVEFVSWESVFQNIAAADPELGSELVQYYARCLCFNGIPAA